jgi:hypothetical protein
MKLTAIKRKVTLRCDRVNVSLIKEPFLIKLEVKVNKILTVLGCFSD